MFYCILLDIFQIIINLLVITNCTFCDPNSYSVDVLLKVIHAERCELSLLKVIIFFFIIIFYFILFYVIYFFFKISILKFNSLIFQFHFFSFKF